MSEAPRLVSAQQLIVTVIDGPDKGVSFKLLSQKVTLGREEDNDISLNDPRCSRHHAVIELLSGEWIMRDLGSQNGIIYNRQPLRQVKLKPGDVVTIGNTELKIDAVSSSAPLAVAAPGYPANPPALETDEDETNRKPILILVVVLVIGAIGYGFMGSKKGTNKSSGIRTEEQIQADIADTQMRKEELSRTKRMEGQFSQQYIEAQSAFIQGFRDYREGNYGRALQSFTAALALYPNHELAQRYKKLSERKLDELVQYSMLEGKLYMEQNKYELAKAAYKNIMVLLNDPNNKTYQEAKERYEEIELLLSGRF